jgi:hypothetical protein
VTTLGDTYREAIERAKQETKTDETAHIAACVVVAVMDSRANSTTQERIELVEKALKSVVNICEIGMETRILWLIDQLEQIRRHNERAANHREAGADHQGSAERAGFHGGGGESSAPAPYG